jgi:hypothetical protein
MDIDALVREVVDMRKTLDAAVRDIERFVKQSQASPVYCPSSPFAPTLEDFAAIMNNDKDDDGA